MAIFTFAATAMLAGTALAGSTFAVSVLSAGLAIATSYGVSMVMKSLSGTEDEPAKTENTGTQGMLAAGGDIPRSFGLGYHMTAGSLSYANYWGHEGLTPNAYITQVIAVSDLPRESLVEVWVSGERVTLSGPVDPDMGQSVAEYAKAGKQHLWIKYYNGTQTTADTFLTGKVASDDRPYGADRIGSGICYVIATALVDDTLFSGFPTFKFALSGIPLYDPSKDSTNGGSGSHLWSNPATWGGDGDSLPAVQVYNILRGIRYGGGAWVYGLQNMSGAARLPTSNWNAQITKCRNLITGLGGLEPSYRSGGQVNCNVQPANAIEAILTACQGRLSEIGGFYKIHLGEPDSAVFSWTDADLLSSEQQTFRPFFSLADSINGIQGTYPNPAEGWETATAPALYRTDLEIKDGNRRLMAAPSFDFVPYGEQVQRLQKSGLEESQRARTHVLPLPPAYWIVEPGDVGVWNSNRNGYIDKLFRVDSVVDRANLDIVLNCTEIDPTDYDWTHAVDYTGVSTGVTIIPRPAAQGVVDWFAEGYTLYDAGGTGRRPAIRIVWDGSLDGIVGIQYEVRLAIDDSHVTRGRTDQYAVGALIISQGLIDNTIYEVRGQYLPSSPRDMLWSDWLTVTTPDIPDQELPEWIADQVTDVFDYQSDRITELEQLMAMLQSTLAARNWTDLKEARTQFTEQNDSAFAQIEHVEQIAVEADAAMASSVETVMARVDIAEDDIAAAEASIVTNATAIATTEAAFASYQVTVSASFGTTNANVTTNATAIATLEGYAAAQYSVTLDVNGYATGFELINGGPGISSTTFVTDKFIIAYPPAFGSGGDPVPIFAVANYFGTPKVVMRGDMYADGTIYANALVTGTITSDSGKIGALSVKSLSIGDQAVVVPVAQTLNTTISGTTANVSSFTMTFDTTGLVGKPITVIAGWVGQHSFTGSGGNPQATLKILGSAVHSVITNDSSDWVLALAGSTTFTASGGAESVGVAVDWVSSGAGGASLGGRTLWAMIGKR